MNINFLTHILYFHIFKNAFLIKLFTYKNHTKNQIFDKWKQIFMRNENIFCHRHQISYPLKSDVKVAWMLILALRVFFHLSSHL